MFSMLKKLSTIGSSKGLILDKTLLGLLGIREREGGLDNGRGEASHHHAAIQDPVEELRARVPEAQDGDATDAAINAATRKVRPETVRKLKTSRAGRRP